jgi:hypothetical protein
MWHVSFFKIDCADRRDGDYRRTTILLIAAGSNYVTGTKQPKPRLQALRFRHARNWKEQL